MPEDDMAAIVVRFRKANAKESTEATADQNASMVLKFLAQENIAVPEDITPSVVQDFLTRLDRAPSTVNNYRAAISRLCSYMVMRGELPYNPVAVTRPAKVQNIYPRYLDDKGIKKCLELAGIAGIYREVKTALFTGMRRGELMRLMGSDVQDTPTGKVFLVRQSKNNRPRTVPMHPELFDIYATPIPPDEPVFRRRGAKSWQRDITKVANHIPLFHELKGSRIGRGWHLLRHTFASRAAQQGVPLQKIAQWLGQSYIHVIQRYAHLAPPDASDEDMRKV